jgi:hypothetical protein
MDPARITRDDVVQAMPILGQMIRYAFYVCGVVVAGMVMFFGLPIRRPPPPKPPVVKLDETPHFSLAAPHLQRLALTTQILQHNYYGRVEVRQYGQLYDRDVDLTLAVIMPPAGVPMIREFGQQLRDIRPMRTAHAVFGQNFFDIYTRFGPVRAVDLRVESDGQWKLCLAYLSRFDTLSLYITGWYCDASGAAPSVEKLACTLDKLAFDGNELQSKAAEAFLREKLAKPASCSATPVSQTIDTRPRGSRPSPPQRWSTPSGTYRSY